jgi:O-antigen/teichoic acid export membrane protein
MSESITKSLVRDIGVVGLSNVLIMLSGIILLRVMVPGLGVENYGYYVQFTVTLSLIYTFVPLGLPYATVRFLAGSKNKEQLQDDIWSTMLLILIASLIAAALFLALSGTIANALFGGNKEIVTILGLMIPIECMNVTMLNLFRVFQHNMRFAVVTTARTYIDIAIIVLLIGNGYGLTEIFLAMLGLRALLFFALLAYTVLYLGLIRPRFLHMKEYFKFGLPNIPANVASWVSDVSDRYLLGILKGSTSVGYYNPGYTLCQVVSMFMSPVDFVMTSALSKYYNEGKIGLVENVYRFSLKYYLLIAIPSAFGLSVLSMPVLLILSSSRDVAANGYLVTPFVALSMLLFGIGAVTTGKVLFLANRNDLNAFIWIVMALANVMLNLALIPYFSITGAAVATAFAYAIGFVMSVYYSRQFYKIPVDWIAIVKMILASVLMSAVVFMLHPVAIIDVLLAISVGVAIYLVFIVLFGVIDRSELDFMKSLARAK